MIENNEKSLTDFLNLSETEIEKESSFITKTNHKQVMKAFTIAQQISEYKGKLIKLSARESIKLKNEAKELGIEYEKIKPYTNEGDFETYEMKRRQLIELKYEFK